ncbi:ArdC family protein [Terribacillus saccharophilus]|uniref:ArdC family protein n=1 Tax=Terribacillus saccharophilus TaxID=361277 RepID=UPI002989BAE9|nr:ArdC family protein [Terribacillus saccharophilus]MCM3227575.1 hypothetical protein [Terribacillus saccharophilus]
MGRISKDDANKQLEEGLKNIFSNEHFNHLLKVMATNKGKSLRNNVLILAQNPEATMTMGYKDWQKIGRQVVSGKGSGITILAPSKKKMEMEKIDPQTEKPELDKEGNVVTNKVDVLVGYTPVKVFDISQTTGKEIPNLREFMKDIMQEDEHISSLYKNFTGFLNGNRNQNVFESATEKGVGGYYNRETKEIVISNTEGLSDSEKFSVLIHEYAHANLHNKENPMKDLPRGHKEAQAESVAYVVNYYYGLDSGDQSIGYIAHWAKDFELAEKALKEVQEVANEIIDDIDRMQKDHILAFYQDQEKGYEEAKKLLVEQHRISPEAFSKENQEETRIQVMNKSNGFMQSMSLEYNEKQQNFFLRSNRNLIEPLSSISSDGNFAILNIEKDLGLNKDVKQFNTLDDNYEVAALRDDLHFVVSKSNKEIVSKGFSTEEEATEFQKKAALAQALHQTTMLKADMKKEQVADNSKEIMSHLEEKVNKAVENYLTKNDSEEFMPIGNSGVTIGWTLMKNPKIKSVEDLKEFAEKNKNVATYKSLQSAIVHQDDKSKNQEMTR